MERFKKENREREVNGFVVCSYFINDEMVISDFLGYFYVVGRS